ESPTKHRVGCETTRSDTRRTRSTARTKFATANSRIVSRRLRCSATSFASPSTNQLTANTPVTRVKCGACAVRVRMTSDVRDPHRGQELFDGIARGTGGKEAVTGV